MTDLMYVLKDLFEIFHLHLLSAYDPRKARIDAAPAVRGTVVTLVFVTSSEGLSE